VTIDKVLARSNVDRSAEQNAATADRTPVRRSVDRSAARTAVPIAVTTVAMSVVRIAAQNVVPTIAAKTGGFAITHTIVDTAKVGVTGIIAITVIIAMTGIIEITGISIAIISVTTMAIIIVATIAAIISGIIHREPISTLDTVHSTIIRGQHSGLSMTVIIFRAIKSAPIMATTIIRSSSVIMIIGGSMIRRTAITGCMIMTAATRSSHRLPRARLSAW